jgi:signal transduction histidine kinase
MNVSAGEPNTLKRDSPPSLADFICTNMDLILQDWEEFAQSLFPAAALTKKTLQDHAKEILQAVAADMARPQSSQVQENKSKELTPQNSSALSAAAEKHANARASEQFDWAQLIAEFRAVRASVLRRWVRENPDGGGSPEEIIRFNESIDEALAASALHYSQKHDEARTVIIGVLAHDLRNPLHAAMMGASYIIQYANADPKCIQSAARIKGSIRRCDQLVSDLLDYARSALDRGLPMSPEAANMRALCSATIDELEAANPGRRIMHDYTGDLNGTWDTARITQLLGNLLTNALKHGHAHTPVVLTASGATCTISVEIHNDGPSIPAAARASLFDPLHLKGGPLGHLPDGSSGLGLGLYICREIAVGHGGEIEVTSNPQFGTSFKITLPREVRTPPGLTSTA